MVPDATSGKGTQKTSYSSVNALVLVFVVVAVVVLAFAVIRSRSRETERELPDTAAGTPMASQLGYRIVRVIDGDSFVVKGEDGAELNLRLAGIDAPERSQPYGSAASESLAALLEGERIRFDDVGRGKYGRILANVYVDSLWVNLEMVRNGSAWSYLDSSSELMRQAEETARRNQAGLWAMKNPVAPWEWRKGRR